MKNKIKQTTTLCWILLAFSIISCKKDNEVGKGAPQITSVHTISKSQLVRITQRVTLDSTRSVSTISVTAFDSAVTSGNLTGQYVILGENLNTVSAISFNGLSVYFNPKLATVNSVIVSIPANTPFGPTQSNKLIVTTLYGQASYDFKINQPGPAITSFTPAGAAAGTTITINGTTFDNLQQVLFDTIPATIVSATTTQIKVIVPNGIDVAPIYVITSGGKATSAQSFGFKVLIYDDAIASGWDKFKTYGSGATVDIANSGPVKRGTRSIGVLYTNANGVFQADYSGATINVSQLGLTAVKFSIYGGIGVTGQVTVVLNGNYTSTQRFYVNPVIGQWNTFTIPLSAFGSPATITSFVLQNRGQPTPVTIYLDDIGII